MYSDFFNEPKREMLCSREYAQELLDISHDERHDGEKWLDVILRYSNPSYQFFYKEEMKKANSLYYRLKWDTAKMVCSLVPSYEVVCLKADETADADHIHNVNVPVTGYSILTTGACFPGAKQCETYYYMFSYGDPVRLADYLLESSEWLFENIIKPEKDMDEIVRVIKDRAFGYPDHMGCVDDRFVFRDEYSFSEFVVASEKDFLDNYPGVGGTRCPDRMLSNNAKENTYRALLRDCVSLSISLHRTVLNPVVYAVALETALIEEAFDRNITLGAEMPLDQIIEKADGYYEEILIHEQEVDARNSPYKPRVGYYRKKNKYYWEDYWRENRKTVYRNELSLEDRFYIFLITGYKARMKKEEPENEEERRYIVRCRDAAIKNKANAFSKYTHPAWDDFDDTYCLASEGKLSKIEKSRKVNFFSTEEKQIREYLLYLVSQGKYDRDEMNGYLDKILYDSREA